MPVNDITATSPLPSPAERPPAPQLRVVARDKVEHVSASSTAPLTWTAKDVTQLAAALTVMGFVSPQKNTSAWTLSEKNSNSGPCPRSADPTAAQSEGTHVVAPGSLVPATKKTEAWGTALLQIAELIADTNARASGSGGHVVSGSGPGFASHDDIHGLDDAARVTYHAWRSALVVPDPSVPASSDNHGSPMMIYASTSTSISAPRASLGTSKYTTDIQRHPATPAPSSTSRWFLLTGSKTIQAKNGTDSAKSAQLWGLKQGLDPGDLLPALLSATVDALVHATAPGSSPWRQRCDAGVIFWYPPSSFIFPDRNGSGGSGSTSWRAWAEKEAKRRYLVSRDPTDAALLLVAVGKTGTLAALYRTAGNTRQADFMARDFSNATHRIAAEKNAYAVRSKHQPELAAALFLLAGQDQLAIDTICSPDGLDDVQLALLVAELLEENSPPTTKPTIPTKTTTSPSSPTPPRPSSSSSTASSSPRQLVIDRLLRDADARGCGATARLLLRHRDYRRGVDESGLATVNTILRAWMTDAVGDTGADADERGGVGWSRGWQLAVLSASYTSNTALRSTISSTSTTRSRSHSTKSSTRTATLDRVPWYTVRQLASRLVVHAMRHAWGGATLEAISMAVPAWRLAEASADTATAAFAARALAHVIDAAVTTALTGIDCASRENGLGGGEFQAMGTSRDEDTMTRTGHLSQGCIDDCRTRRSSRNLTRTRLLDWLWSQLRRQAGSPDALLDAARSYMAEVEVARPDEEEWIPRATSSDGKSNTRSPRSRRSPPPPPPPPPSQPSREPRPGSDGDRSDLATLSPRGDVDPDLDPDLDLLPPLTTVPVVPADHPMMNTTTNTSTSTSTSTNMNTSIPTSSSKWRLPPALFGDSLDPILAATLVPGPSSRGVVGAPLIVTCTASTGLAVRDLPRPAQQAWEKAWRGALASEGASRRSPSFFDAVQGMLFQRPTTPTLVHPSKSGPRSQPKSSNWSADPETRPSVATRHAWGSSPDASAPPPLAPPRSAYSPPPGGHPMMNSTSTSTSTSTPTPSFTGSAHVVRFPTTRTFSHHVQTVRASRLLTRVLRGHPRGDLVGTGASGGRAAIWRLPPAPERPSRMATGVYAFHAPGEAERSRFANDPFSQVADVTFSVCGQKMAGILESGTVALWSVARGGGDYGDGGAATTPEWTHRCFARRGSAIAFLPASSSTFLVGGAGSEAPRSIVLMDAAAPPPPHPAAVLSAHDGLCHALAISPSTPYAYSGGADGVVAVWDVRKLGGTHGGVPVRLLESLSGVVPATPTGRMAAATWRTRNPPPSPPRAAITALATGSLRVLGSLVPVVCAGNEVGDVAVWDAVTLRPLYVLRGAHARPTTGWERWKWRGGAGPTATTGSPVSAVHVTEHAIFTAGGDGRAQMFFVERGDESG